MNQIEKTNTAPRTDITLDTQLLPIETQAFLDKIPDENVRRRMARDAFAIVKHIDVMTNRTHTQPSSNSSKK